MENNLENGKWKMENKGLRIAIVCDWLIGTGGAERVVLELHRMYPEAPIYTSQYDQRPSTWHGEDWFKDANVRTGWLQKLPLSLRKFMPVLRIWYFSRLDLHEYDIVISSSGAEAKGIHTTPRKPLLNYGKWKMENGKSNMKSTLHISYMHSPTHYYWARYEQYMENPGFGRLDPLARFGLKLLVGPLRNWDYKAAQRPDFIVANSTHIKNMINKFYGRDSVVIFPPVETERFKLPTTTSQLPEHRRGYITAGRQTPYKRIDIAVRAANELNLPLIVLGGGPDHARLKRLAGKSVTFLRGKDDEELAHYFQTSLGFIFPNLDDFGITAVEALAAGTPVIAYQAGGALDYIQEGRNGLFFKHQTVESLVEALKKFNSQSFNNQTVSASAEKFSVKSFRDDMGRFIKSIYEGKN